MFSVGKGGSSVHTGLLGRAHRIFGTELCFNVEYINIYVDIDIYIYTYTYET